MRMLGHPVYIKRYFVLLYSFVVHCACRGIAAEVKRPMADVSLAWVLQQQNIGTCLMGARNATQLTSNLASDLDHAAIRVVWC